METLKENKKTIHYELGPNKSVLIHIRRHKWDERWGFKYRATAYFTIKENDDPKTFFDKRVEGWVEYPEETDIEEVASKICDVALSAIYALMPDFAMAVTIDLLDIIDIQRKMILDYQKQQND